MLSATHRAFFLQSLAVEPETTMRNQDILRFWFSDATAAVSIVTVSSKIHCECEVNHARLDGACRIRA